MVTKNSIKVSECSASHLLGTKAQLSKAILFEDEWNACLFFWGERIIIIIIIIITIFIINIIIINIIIFIIMIIIYIYIQICIYIYYII